MARNREYQYYVADFETTVYEGQTDTLVWASAIVPLNTEDVAILGSIDATWDYIKSLKTNCIIYYHNLKFDGNFWINYLLAHTNIKPAINGTVDELLNISWKKPKEMQNNTFTVAISDMGAWYTLKIKYNNYMIEFRDSAKLLPFSVREIGSAFKTKHQKLDMEYTGFRYPNCPISEEEQEYIKNDVLVVKEALEIMFEQGHNKLTIGSCCLAEYKSLISQAKFDEWFPNVYEVELDKNTYGYDNCGEYVRKSYKGGWCYIVPEKSHQIKTNGTTADVNSLYPSMMSSESGNRYPVGLPTFWSGDYIPDEAFQNQRYFFVRVRTRFYIKKDKLPFIQIKGSKFYKGTEALRSSDIVNEKTGESSAYYKDIDGNVHDTRVTLTMTCTDYKLFLEHYTPVDFEILDGCWFESEIGIFDKYIDKYKKIKLESKGALRTLAKLFLNNLYGKMASNTDSSFKFPYLKEDGSVGFSIVQENNKKPGFIPVGSAITSYARNFTIRAAQANYYGTDKRGFIYADTDSIHCDLQPDEIKGIKVHDKNFCCWKLESSWDVGYFVRQKTYIEHVVAEDLEPIEEPYYNIKCAGMPDKCKKLFDLSMRGYEPKESDKYKENELKFLEKKRTIEDFKEGLVVPGKLLPKRIKGGVLLVETSYEMR